MGGFLGGLVSNAVGFAPYAAKALQENDDRNMAKAAQALAQQRQAATDKLQQALGASTISKNAADADEAAARAAKLREPTEGQWGAAFAGTDGQGNPVMLQQHKLTGEVRPITIGGDAPPRQPLLSADAFKGPSSADWNASLTGKTPPQEGAQAPTPIAPQRPQTGRTAVRPYVKPSPGQNDRTPRTFTANGQPVEGFSDKQGNFYDAAGVKVTGKITPYVAPQHDAFTFTPGTDPTTGNPTVFAGNSHTGQLTNTGVGKPAAGAASGQNAPQMAAAKANIESARKIMDDFEAKLKAGQAHYGVLDATQGALASSPTALNAKGVLGAVESFGANAASSHLQSSNAELARYMTAKKYVAEAILNTHKRPNQTQYEIEQELSGIGPNPSPEQVDMAKARRDRMYNEVFNNPQAGGFATTVPHAAAPAAHSDPLLAKYGIKPTVP